jgi:hypothetical protein
MTIDESWDAKTLLRTLGDLLNEGFLVVDETGNIKFANEEFLIRIGDFGKEVLGNRSSNIWTQRTKLD